MSKILITGINGFIGQHLALELRSRDMGEVVGLSRSEADPDLLPEEVCVADLTDIESLKRAVRRISPSIVFHLAGLSRGSHTDLMRANVVGTANLFCTLSTLPHKPRVILAGSAAEYGATLDSDGPVEESAICEPLNPYGWSKLAATELARSASMSGGLETCVARLFNVVGPGMPTSLLPGALIERIVRALQPEAPNEVVVGRTDTKRDFISVRDVVIGLIGLAEAEQIPAIVNLSSAVATPISEVVDSLVAMAPLPLEVRVDSNLIRPDEVESICGSNSIARETIGFRPNSSLEETLRQALNELLGRKQS